MFQQVNPDRKTVGGSDVAELLDRVTQVSTRPRYAFMLLALIAEVAKQDGSAGPVVRQHGSAALLRDWLCDALSPIGRRDPRRIALIERVREELAKQGALPADKEKADAIVDAEVRERVRVSGKANLSRAVSELVAAGLLRRHYQGYYVDHHNRGGQRHAVYTLTGLSKVLIADTKPTQAPRPRAGPAQGELAF